MTILRGYPSTMPSATFGFAASKKLDPRIAFSRASAASPDSSAMVDGKVQTFGIDVPRLSDQGLLIEEGSTNYIITSVKSIGTPIGTNVTVTNNATDVAAPDGTFTATRIQADSISYIPVGFSGGITFSGADLSKVPTFSYWIYPKSIVRSGQTAVGMYFENDGDQFTKNFKVVLNKWQRIFITWEGTFDQTKPFNLSVMRGCTDLAAYFWGFQCEPKNFPTSLIPTNGSTVTRAADTAEMPADYNVNQYTIINHDFGVAGGSDTLTIIGAGTTPAQRTAVYSDHLTQEEVNAVAGVDDWWEWRVKGTVFGLNALDTDAVVQVDWGDGSPIENTFNGISHTFTNGSGYHTIKFKWVSGTFWRPKVGNKSDYRDAFISTGPAPESFTVGFATFAKSCPNFKALDSSIKVEPIYSFQEAFQNANKLLSFPFMDTSTIQNFSKTWSGNDKLTSFPLLDTSSGTNFSSTWLNCRALKEFPLLDLSSGTSFGSCWQDCESLTSFPQLDFSSATYLQAAWRYCDGLTSFPLLSFPIVTDVDYAWDGCNQLASFPAIDMPDVTTMTHAWRSCSSLTSFPLIDVSVCTKFQQSWQNCSSLVTFPANFFNTIGTPVANCFNRTWDNCTDLSATSVENILNSIDTSGQSAPAGTGTQMNIDIDYNASSGVPYGGSVDSGGIIRLSDGVTQPASIVTLKSRGWTVTIGGTAQ